MACPPMGHVQPQESPYKSVLGCTGVVERLVRQTAEDTVEILTRVTVIWLSGQQRDSGCVIKRV